MGYYIQAPFPHGKAQYIVKEHGGQIVSREEAEKIALDPNSDKAVIVVVDNGLFEAAGLAYSPEEFQEFASPTDNRPRTYVIMDGALACKLSGYSK